MNTVQITINNALFVEQVKALKTVIQQRQGTLRHQLKDGFFETATYGRTFFGLVPTVDVDYSEDRMRQSIYDVANWLEWFRLDAECVPKIQTTNNFTHLCILCDLLEVAPLPAKIQATTGVCRVLKLLEIEFDMSWYVE